MRRCRRLRKLFSWTVYGGLPCALFHGNLRRLPKRKKSLLPFFTAQRRLDAWASRKGEPFFGAFLQCRSFVPACRFFDVEALVRDRARGLSDIFFCCNGCPGDRDILTPGMRHGNVEHDLIVQCARYLGHALLRLVNAREKRRIFLL